MDPREGDGAAPDIRLHSDESVIIPRGRWGQQMAWFLQTPDAASPKLLANIVDKCGPAIKGAAAFAFASANGVKLLLAEPAFQHLLEKGEFLVIVGLDAITDTRAVEELRKARTKYANFKAKLFSHDKVGTIFHPKTILLRSPQGGCIITGSGNLTPGGLRSNWEALAVEVLTAAEIDAAEAQWEAWLEEHSNNLLGLNFVTTIVWQQRTTRENRKVFSNNHEYILVYAADFHEFKKKRGFLNWDDEVLSRFKNPDSDPRGPWQSVSANVQAGHATKSQFYDLVAPTGKRHRPPKGRCWVFNQSRMKQEIANNNVWFGKSGS